MQNEVDRDLLFSKITASGTDKKNPFFPAYLKKKEKRKKEIDHSY